MSLTTPPLFWMASMHAWVEIGGLESQTPVWARPSEGRSARPAKKVAAARTGRRFTDKLRVGEGRGGSAILHLAAPDGQGDLGIVREMVVPGTSAPRRSVAAPRRGVSCGNERRRVGTVKA